MSNWTRVEDGLPEPNVEVQVRCESKILDNDHVKRNNYGSDYISPVGNWDWCDDVTHWRYFEILEIDK